MKPDLTLPTEAELEELRVKAREDFKRRQKESQEALRKAHTGLPTGNIKKRRKRN